MSVAKSIKEAAKNNNTKIQTSECAKLEAILNRMFYLDKNIKEETNFIKQVMTRGQESQERKGLHASAMLASENDFCMRAQVLSLMYKQLQGEQIGVGLMRIFEEGNAIHEKWQRLFIRAGYGTAKDMDFTLTCEKYKLCYTPDILCCIPEFFPGRMVGEIKSVNHNKYMTMKRHDSAWKQCYWYSHLMIQREKELGTWNGIDWTKGFVLNDDKNTQDFKVEIYNYNPEIVAPFVKRSEAIVKAYNRVKKEKKMVKRPEDADSPTCERCAKCNMRDACWNIGIGRVKL